MKTLHLSIIISAVVVAISISVLEVFFQNPPHGGYMLAQNDTLPQKNSTHTCISKKDQEFDPGSSGFDDLMCPFFFFHTYTKVDGYSGFADVCFDKRYNAGNYILKAGHNGSITYTVYPDIPLSYAITFPHVNMTNSPTFSHYKFIKGGEADYTYTDTIPGVNVSFEPKYEVLWPWSQYLVTANISIAMDAEAGSHWLVLSPGPCNGGPAFILTIDNSSKVN